MPRFRYKARDRDGILVRGTTQAQSRELLAQGLRELGHKIVSIEEVKERFAFLEAVFQRLQAIRPEEVAVVVRQMATMLRAGIPLLECLVTISQQVTNPKLRRVLVLLSEDVKAGSSFSTTLEKHRSIFSPLFVSMVRAGETAGIMEEVLDRLAAIAMQEVDLRNRVRSALVYPIVLTMVAISVVTFLLTGVLPKFIAIFEESGARLPVPTVILLTISRLLQRYWYILVAAIAGGVALVRLYLKRPKGRFRVHQMFLRLPVFGDLALKLNLARLFRTLGALLKSGIPIHHALVVVEDVARNQVLKHAVQSLRHAVVEGQSISEPMRLSGVFPTMVVQMAATGEKTGHLSELLIEVGNFYEEEVTTKIAGLTSLLEPMLLVVMGSMIGFIVLSVLLPMFNLIRVFKGTP